jgi:sporulation protein YtfJ
MSTHPIEGLMKVAMENIKEMVDVNTIVGDPVETPDGSVIMPISKVGFGFAAGGSEFKTDVENEYLTTTATTVTRTDAHNASVALPFGGGSGGGVSITPIAFLVVSKMGVKVVPLDNQTHIWERLIDSAPMVAEKIQSMLKGGMAQNTAPGTPGSPMGGMSGGMSGMTSGTGMSSGAGAAGTSSNSGPTVKQGNDNQNFIV